ncbi:MAG: HDIG domain-containing protein [Deltaproteobacteria bacterium]|jgi:putative nucleotidyltransferase with HDIG domain|nr:HDIG domain-containing protein [Deltaproteobacteria bacterium]
MTWLRRLAKLAHFKSRPGSERYAERSAERFSERSWRLIQKLSQPASLGLRMAFVVIIAGATAFMANPAPENYQVGLVADRAIRSDREIYVADPGATAAARQAAYRATTAVFVLDERVTDLTITRIRALFREAREYLLYSGQLPKPLAADILAFFPGPDKEDLLTQMALTGFSESLERLVAWLTLELLTQGVLDESQNFDFTGQNVEITRLGLGLRHLAPYDTLLTKQKAAYLLASRTRQMDLESNAHQSQQSQLAARLALACLTPNLTLNINEFNHKRLQAVIAIPEVKRYVAPGEILIREGQKVDAQTALKLNALREETAQRQWLVSSLGLLVLFLIFLTVAQTVSALEKKFLYNNREQILVILTLLTLLFMAWSAGRLGQGLTSGFDNIETHTVFLAMPFATATIICSIFLGLRRALFITFIGSLLAASIAPIDYLTAFFYICNGSMIANWRLKHISERGRLIPAAGLVAVVNCLTLLGLTLLKGGSFDGQFLFDLDAALLSGVLSGTVASGLVPFFEMTLGFTTNLKLMELGNLNRPILRELMLAAPGTYHHSVIVGSMVEAAAEAIGANNHLARVGAYYHDIGKVKKPLYFIENQMGENRHESLTPTMSALVLVGHVKDGVEMAKANGLPPAVIDIIEQHHGSSLMSFFYHKAMERRPADSPDINEGDFRYPGPKPASKEAGLVMLADICEAATRTLTEPTPTKIRDLVRALVNRIFDDGQLDASDLVLKDVTETIRVFTNILVGIYHHRIAYPAISKAAHGDQAAKSKVIYGHIDNEQPKRLAH